MLGKVSQKQGRGLQVVNGSSKTQAEGKVKKKPIQYSKRLTVNTGEKAGKPDTIRFNQSLDSKVDSKDWEIKLNDFNLKRKKNNTRQSCESNTESFSKNWTEKGATNQGLLSN